MAATAQRILLGVSGGIAAYKACEVTRHLRAGGAQVRVVMTQGATQFVSPTTFQALSGQPVRVSLWDAAAEAAMGHIELARWAQRILIAPASADVLARLAHGLADDLLTTVCLASEAPLWVAPAMNQQMWAHAATQANLRTLAERGVKVLGPASGEQACGEIGPGRLLEPRALATAVLGEDGGTCVLEGVRVLVSAGPTYEDIDPVRFIGNRSSGRMGFAIAEAAAAAGARVHLVSGPVALETPPGVDEREDVRDARSMREAVLRAARQSDIFIAAAAVADFRPRESAARKLKKADRESLEMELVRNPDILAEVAALDRRPFLVGFAAETEDLEQHARDKLARKRLDMIAANRVGAGLGMETEDNALELFWNGGGQDLARAPKRELARRLLDCISERYRQSRA